MDLIALIEELAANAVPAAITQELDGWRLRANGGVTRRANSVLAAAAGGRLALAERIALAEGFYARRGQSARFQLCPASQPAELPAALLARGYITAPPSRVQVGPIDSLRAEAAGRARVAEGFDDAWLAAYAAGEGERSPANIAIRAQMLGQIGPPAGFAAIEQDGQIAAVALGVVERGWLGIFNVATHPAYRRRGLSRALLSDLGAWAAGQGATRSYLQVYSLNTPALHLYAGLGFRPLYEYVYYEKQP